MKKLAKPNQDKYKEPHKTPGVKGGGSTCFKGTQIIVTTDFFLGSVKARRPRIKSIKC